VPGCPAWPRPPLWPPAVVPADIWLRQWLCGLIKVTPVCIVGLLLLHTNRIISDGLVLSFFLVSPAAQPRAHARGTWSIQEQRGRPLVQCRSSMPSALKTCQQDVAYGEIWSLWLLTCYISCATCIVSTSFFLINPAYQSLWPSWGHSYYFLLVCCGAPHAKGWTCSYSTALVPVVSLLVPVLVIKPPRKVRRQWNSLHQLRKRGRLEPAR